MTDQALVQLASATAAGLVALAVGFRSVTQHVLTASMWAAAALFALNTAGNLTGLHPVERFGASTVTGLVTVLCLLIAVVR